MKVTACDFIPDKRCLPRVRHVGPCRAACWNKPGQLHRRSACTQQCPMLLLQGGQPGKNTETVVPPTSGLGSPPAHIRGKGPGAGACAPDWQPPHHHPPAPRSRCASRAPRAPRAHRACCLSRQDKTPGAGQRSPTPRRRKDASSVGHRGQPAALWQQRPAAGARGAVTSRGHAVEGAELVMG